VEKCVLNRTGAPIYISMLQRFAMDYGKYEREPVPGNGIKVAVIGSGPSGLGCASELARHGYEVTVFESKSVAGGMVAYGVPEYRCPHEVTAREVEKIVKEGVEIKTSTPVNQDVSQLFDMGFKAVYVAVGLTRTSRPEIPGMRLKGIYMGIDFLNRISSGDIPEVGRKVVVIGGGDTALDCARSALRLGAKDSTVMYRRSFVELPADKEEIKETLDEGVIFRTLTQPVAFYGDDEEILRAVECVDVKLGKKDESGRRKPLMIRGSEYRIAANTVIFATGTEPSKLLKRILPKAEYVRDKFLKVDPETMMTSVPGVFGGGDVVNMGATVVLAVAEGKKAARGIMEYLKTRKEKAVEEEIRDPKEVTAPEEITIPEEKRAIEEVSIQKKVEEALEVARETLKKLEGDEVAEIVEPPEAEVEKAVEEEVVPAEEEAAKEEAAKEEVVPAEEEAAKEEEAKEEVVSAEEEEAKEEVVPAEEEAIKDGQPGKNGLNAKREALRKKWEHKLKLKKVDEPEEEEEEEEAKAGVEE